MSSTPAAAAGSAPAVAATPTKLNPKVPAFNPSAPVFNP